MFCMKCGTELPDGAAFCWKCGTPVGQVGTSEAPAQTPAVMKAEPLRMQPMKKPEYFMGKKQQMVYVPGTGLFFIADDNDGLYFLADGADSCKKLNRKANLTAFYGMGYYRNAVYYWHFCDDPNSKHFGDELWKIDTATQERSLVIKKLAHSPSITNKRVILHEGCYYYIDGWKRILYRLSIDSGEISTLPLPDLRSGTVPEDWKRPDAYVDMESDEENYAERYDGFDIVGGYGFVSLDGGAPCTLRFALDDPSQFQCLPMDTCTAVEECSGLLTQIDGVLYGGMRGLRERNSISRLELENGRVVRCQKIANSEKLKGKVHEYGMKYWWKQGPIIFVGRMGYDTEEQKFYILPEWLNREDYCYTGSIFEVQDFAEDGRGGAFILEEIDNGRHLYHLPKDWYSAKDRDELEQRYRIAKLGK